ncbi:MAG: acetylxylan esterase [Treponema sp.]|jgi:cephalosporin-C deacetylase|nr:acetylxylan esterase [Treponema sp.]
MLVDLKPKELFSYQGRNPRPVDFDGYWAQAMGELEGLDPSPEWKPAAFKAPFAECFDLSFTGVRGARIYANFIKPKKTEGRAPAVFAFHGYSGNSGDWTGLLHFAAAGMAVAAMDCRGQGGKSEDRGGVQGNTLHGQIIRGLDSGPGELLFRHIFLDTVQLVRLVSSLPEIDRNRLGCFGGSQGGGLSLVCAALCPEIKRAAPRMPFLCDYQRVWEMDLAKGAYQELQDYFRRFDPRHEREKGIFTTLGYIDVQHLAPRIKAEVLMFTGLMDTICPPSTQFAAYNKITSKKNIKLYPDYAHENYPDSMDMTFEFMMGL